MTKVSIQSTGKVDKVSTSADLSRELRRALRGITQAELAAQLLVSRNYISQIEAGLKEPSKRLRLQMEELLTESAERNKVSSDAGAPRVEESPSGYGDSHSEESHGSPAAIEREIRRDLDALISAAMGDPQRLHWIAEQMKRHLASAPHWQVRAKPGRGGAKFVTIDPATAYQPAPPPSSSRESRTG